MKIKSLLALVTTIGALVLPGAARAEDAAPVPANPSGFVIQRGTNLSHWLSQDFRWHPRNAWLTQNDIEFIAHSGFDHVRLPIDEAELWNEDGTKNVAAFAEMRSAIDWCRAAHLRVILDLHVIRSHHFNADNEGLKNTLFTDPKKQQHLLDLWKDLIATVGDVPNNELAYEILNEPVADNPEDWNKLVASAVKYVRAKEPGRVLVIGANRWQMPQSFPGLKVPEGDKNIILSFHTYAPMLFTHYTAKWLPLKDFTGPVNYPGLIVSQKDMAPYLKTGTDYQLIFFNQALENWNAERIRKEIEPAIIRARELGLQLYCGEFGCLPTVPRAARLAYYRDIVGVFNSNGIAWSNWEYKGDFGIFEWHGEKEILGAPDTGLIDVLMQK